MRELPVILNIRARGALLRRLFPSAWLTSERLFHVYAVTRHSREGGINPSGTDLDGRRLGCMDILRNPVLCIPQHFQVTNENLNYFTYIT